MTKRSSKTLAKDLGLVGEDAVAVLLAALGSQPKKSAASSSKISSSKTKRSGKKRTSTKKHSQEASKCIKTSDTPKLTATDIKLRMMVATAEPGRCYTLQEIAEVVGVSRERIRQLEFQALKNLRKKMSKIIREDNIEGVDLL